MYIQISAIVSNWNVQIFQRILCFDKDLKECLSLNSPLPSKTETVMFFCFTLLWGFSQSFFYVCKKCCLYCMCVLSMCKSFSYLLQVADKICEQHEGPHQSKLCCFFILVRCIVLLLISCTLYHLCTTKMHHKVLHWGISKSPHTIYFQSNVDHVCNIKSVQRNILCIKYIISYNTGRRDVLEIFP